MIIYKYGKCPQMSYVKVADKIAYANNADPDQTAPEGALVRVYTVCHSTKHFKTQLHKQQNSTRYFKTQLHKKQNLGKKGYVRILRTFTTNSF